MYSWSVSAVLGLFLVVVFVIGLVLMLSVVTQKDCHLEADRANTIRAQLFLLLGVVLAGVAILASRFELGHAVKHLME
jgi:hypothetical protein